MAKNDEAKQALERAIFQMLTQIGGFYACVITAMQTKFVDGFGTLGVGFTKEEKILELIVDPEFFVSLNEKERVGILWHEVMHVLNLHLLIRDKDFPDQKHANIAMDLAINPVIETGRPDFSTLPKGMILPRQYGFADKKAADHYYAELTKEKEQEQPQDQQGESDSQPQDGEGKPQSGKGKPKKGKEQPKTSSDGTTMDKHDWDCDGKPQQEKIDAVKNTLERAQERAQKMGAAGKIPDSVGESLAALEKMKVKQWHRELQRFVSHNTDGSDRDRTWSRPNKRYGLWEAGTKCAGNKKIIIGVDTSGSMSATEIQHALAECKSMLRCSVEAEVWFFDTRVHAKAKLKKNGEYQLSGRGGTDFNDFFAQAQKKHPDAVVVFTDAEDGGTLTMTPKMPILWVLTAGEREGYPFGRKVVLDK